MKVVSFQTEGSPARQPRFRYEPDRHYVSCEAPNGQWDGDGLDRLLDMVDPETGVEAYRIEASGDTAEGRRVTGDRRKVLISCSKEFADRVSQANSNQSQELAASVATETRTQFERFGPASLD